MEQLLSRLDSGQLTIVLVVAAVMSVSLVIGVTSVIAHAWRSVRERQMAISIVVEMLEQGMSAEEVVRVLQAAGTEKQSDRVLAAVGACRTCEPTTP